MDIPPPEKYRKLWCVGKLPFHKISDEIAESPKLWVYTD